MKISALKKLASEVRLQIIEMSHSCEAPHLGSSLSCVDLLIAAYFSYLNVYPQKPSSIKRDRFILSKGHAISSLYAVLAKKGFFEETLLKTFNFDGSSLPEHPTPNCIPGVEVATGSLGHGLSIGIGFALAAKIQDLSYRVMVLLSDGECNEGSVWEAALFAPIHKLDNLVAIIDYNKWQATGKSNEIMKLDPLKEKWASFGWCAVEIDGNSLEELVPAFAKIPEHQEKPTVFIAHTVKGKGISFMEDDNNWHYRIPSNEEISKAKQELGFVQ